MAGHFEPFGVLVEHRIDDVNESLVAIKKAVASGEQITLKPTLAQMLAEDLHNVAGGGEILIGRQNFSLPHAFIDFKNGVPAIGLRFVWSNDAKEALVEFENIADESALNASGLAFDSARGRHFDGIIAKIRHAQIAEQFATIGVWVGAHAVFGFWREVGQFGKQAPIVIE